MQRTIKINLRPTEKKLAEIQATMEVYRESVNKFITQFAGYKYLDKLNYKVLYRPGNHDKRIASNYSTNALAYAVTLLNNRLDVIRKNCKARIFKHIKDKNEQHYLFYLLKQPKYIKAIMQQKKFKVDKEFEVTREADLNKYLHRILRHEFKNNSIPELKKLMLRTTINLATIRPYKNSKHFSHVLRLSTINKGKRIVIPFNPNKWVQKYLDKRKGCYIICLDPAGKLKLYIPIEEKVKKNQGTKKVGIDVGFNTLLADSNIELYGENWNDLETKLDDKFQKKQKQRGKIHSLRKELHKKFVQTKDKKIYKKIKNLEKYNLGKKKFNQTKIKTQATIKNKVNKVVNQFIAKNPDIGLIALEKLDFKPKPNKYNKKINRLLNQWKRGYLKSKLTFISQLNSIELAYQNPAYTSQECPICGYVHPDNRNGAEFICIKCGFSANAEVVGAWNTLQRECDPEIGLYTPAAEVKAILLKRYSVGDIKPPRLETLNHFGYESCKQSIQERNINQATGGESLNLSHP